MRLLHQDLTYKIRGCIFDTHNKLGLGYDEESYHLFLERQFKMQGISYQSKVIRYLEHHGVKIHKFIADLVIDDRVILELKNITTDFVPANFQQILFYLKRWKIDLGMLVNFGQPRVNIERVPFTEKALNVFEDFDDILGFLFLENKEYFVCLRTAILTIFEQFGLGYNASIYKTLLETELRHRNIAFVSETSIPVVYDGIILRNYRLKCPIVGNRILCYIIAGQEETHPNLLKMKNYLRETESQFGILVHFGKEKLELIGVQP